MPDTAADDIGRWTAIVLAGQRPGVDALARAFGRTAKAEIPVLGRAMIARVTEALLAAPSVGSIFVLAQRPDAFISPEFRALLDGGRVMLRQGGDGISRSIAAVAGTGDAPWPVLITTADHPLLTPATIEAFLAGAAHADLAVGMVESSVLLAAYPESRRTWLRFSDGAWSGANLFALGSGKVAPMLELWSRAEGDRKNAVRLFFHFGPLLALRALTRSIGLGDAIARVGRRMGLTARLVPLADPEAAIDVDKLSDHRQVEAILRAREQADAAPAPSPLTGVSVFDLDRTLTRHPTYTPLLLHGARRIAPWRLLLAPVVLGVMIGHALGLVSRRRTKEYQQGLLLGGSLSSEDAARLAEDFADRLDRDGLLAKGRQRIAREHQDGRRVILATAANHFYAGALARRLGINDVVATQSVRADDRLSHRIEGENCYGAAKREMVERYLEALGLRRADLHVRFFSDHVSDRPSFEWADEPFAVNPSRKLRKLAAAKGWPILDWR